MRFEPDDILTIEAILKSGGVAIADVCKEAEINPTTWMRWRKRAGGDLRQPSPSVATWGKVDAVLNKLLAPKSETAA